MTSTDRLVDQLEQVAYEKARLELQAEQEQAERARAAEAPKQREPITDAAAYAQALYDAQSKWQTL